MTEDGVIADRIHRTPFRLEVVERFEPSCGGECREGGGSERNVFVIVPVWEDFVEDSSVDTI